MTEQPTKTFEDRLMEAVVSQFFSPEWTTQAVWNPSTNQTEPQMLQYPSPSARVASEVFKTHEAEILGKVLERLDIDALADAVWERIEEALVQRLTDTGRWSVYRPEQDALRTRINELIATELARRALEKMDQSE